MFKCIIGVIAGGIFLFIGCSFALRTNDFLKTSVTVSGRVVDLESGPNHPTIEFLTQNGERIRIPQGGFIPPLVMGESVPIRYTPNAPRQTAVIDSFGAIWGRVLIFLFFGLIGSIGSILTYFIKQTSK